LPPSRRPGPLRPTPGAAIASPACSRTSPPVPWPTAPGPHRHPDPHLPRVRRPNHRPHPWCVAIACAYAALMRPTPPDLPPARRTPSPARAAPPARDNRQFDPPKRRALHRARTVAALRAGVTPTKAQVLGTKPLRRPETRRGVSAGPPLRSPQPRHRLAMPPAGSPPPAARRRDPTSDHPSPAFAYTPRRRHDPPPAPPACHRLLRSRSTRDTVSPHVRRIHGP